MPVVSRRRRSQTKPRNTSNETERLPTGVLDHALRLIYAVCCFAGSGTWLDDNRGNLRAQGVIAGLRTNDTAAVFDWLVETLSYQGIADRVAADYMQRHGRITWRQIARDLQAQPTCPKLRSYWTFNGCRYAKGSHGCAEPEHLHACPLPRHNLRNGHLNQLAYSLFLFIRDLAAANLVAWIDATLANADSRTSDRLVRMQDSLLRPLRNVHGVSDKVLAMSLSMLLLAAGTSRPAWAQVGARLIAVDTLVHNFLHRTGILARLAAPHTYGPGCYQAGGCAAIIRMVAQQIDARTFNRGFPKVFPRFVQHAIWRYCAAGGLNVCNGNRIDDTESCNNRYCQLFSQCDRVVLYKS